MDINDNRSTIDGALACDKCRIAFEAITLDIILFLFGMFSIVSALEKSGVLGVVAIKMVSGTKGNPNYLLLVFVVGLGILSAFLVNDTIAILGVPLAIYVMRSAKPIPIVLLFGLAFGISIGSVMTPIGNPQNLLIAIQGGANDYYCKNTRYRSYQL